MTTAPHQVDINLVVAAVGCHPTRAIALLKGSGNSAEKAIQLYKETKRNYLTFGREFPIPEPSPTSSKSQPRASSPESDLSKCENGTDTIHPEDDDDAEWDFVLPRVLPPPATTPSQFGLDIGGDFSLIEVIGAIQAGEATESVLSYLSFYENASVNVSDLINDQVRGYHSFFYVVEMRNAALVRIWAKYGADLNARAGANRVPLLAYAISIGGTYENDTRDVVTVLLSFGADVGCIPKAYHTPLGRDLPRCGLEEAERLAEAEMGKGWLTRLAAAKIAGPLNFSFTLRTHLHLAALLPRRSGAERQVAAMRGSTELLGIPFFLIGQVPASTVLIDRLLGLVNMAMPSKRPVVFVFAGPSGHGKTEIAQQLGRLLSLDCSVIDCASIERETDMFGPRPPFVNYEAGSPLNNFIAAHNGKRCVIFLDEFEKTNGDVRQTLLIPFQNGVYQDRRDLSSVDCSKAIWILTTNAFDDTILDFCRKNRVVLEDPERLAEATKLVKGLSTELKKESIGRFGAPITGRITQFIPFLTFSPCEAAAVADKYLAELGRELHQKIRLPLSNDKNSDAARMVGNIDMGVRRGWSLCNAIADQGYVEELGARSVMCEVDAQVKFPLIYSFLTSLESVGEEQERRGYVVDVNADQGVEVTLVRGKGEGKVQEEDD